MASAVILALVALFYWSPPGYYRPVGAQPSTWGVYRVMAPGENKFYYVKSVPAGNKGGSTDYAKDVPTSSQINNGANVGSSSNNNGNRMAQDPRQPPYWFPPYSTRFSPNLWSQPAQPQPTTKTSPTNWQLLDTNNRPPPNVGVGMGVDPNYYWQVPRQWNLSTRFSPNQIAMTTPQTVNYQQQIPQQPQQQIPQQQPYWYQPTPAAVPMDPYRSQAAAYQPWTFSTRFSPDQWMRSHTPKQVDAQPQAPPMQQPQQVASGGWPPNAWPQTPYRGPSYASSPNSHPYWNFSTRFSPYQAAPRMQMGAGIGRHTAYQFPQLLKPWQYYWRGIPSPYGNVGSNSSNSSSSSSNYPNVFSKNFTTNSNKTNEKIEIEMSQLDVIKPDQAPATRQPILSWTTDVAFGTRPQWPPMKSTTNDKLPLPASTASLIVGASSTVAPFTTPFMLTSGMPKTTTQHNYLPSSSERNNKTGVECGKNVYMLNEPGNAVAQSIVGGMEARLNEFPWQVRINYRTGFVCGGAIISKRHVLTAAHCVIGPAANYQLVLGDHSRTEKDRGEVVMNVTAVVNHPGYTEEYNQFDLAIMVTETDIPFDSTVIRPVCLPEGDMVPSSLDFFAGHQAQVTGWGRLKESGGIPPTLQKGTVPILPQADCTKAYRTTKFTDDMMCAGYNTGKIDTCQGDSGGPLVLLSNDGRFYIQGVTSWGYGCARPNYPGVYARVASSLDWIKKTMDPRV